LQIFCCNKGHSAAIGDTLHLRNRNNFNTLQVL